MKLRIRSVDTRETLRLEAPDCATLSDLKSLLAAKLAAGGGGGAPAPSPVPAESIRLSLNRSDELLSPSPAATLLSLGLTSGDLLFFSLSPLPNPNPDMAAAAAAAAAAIETETETTVQTLGPNPNEAAAPGVEAAQTFGPVPSLEVEMAEAAEEKAEASSSAAAANREMETKGSTSSSSFVASLLKKAMEAERAGGAECSLLGRLVVAAHAAFLDAGFLVVAAGSGSRLPQGWASVACTSLTIKYTVPELASRIGETEEHGKVAILNYSVLGNFVTIYGYLTDGQPDVYRVCLDAAAKLAPLLSLDAGSVGDAEEREILALWNSLKDALCLPLMIGLCVKNGLPLPPCFGSLSADLKAKILEFVPGVDLARVECTCSELKNLASDSSLWKKKYEEEFKSAGESSMPAGSWKKRYERAWVAKQAATKVPRRSNARLWNFGRRYNPVSPYGFPMIGGDFDRFPAIGELNSQGQRFGNHRRNFSPHCNLGGYSGGFLG